MRHELARLKHVWRGPLDPVKIWLKVKKMIF